MNITNNYNFILKSKYKKNVLNNADLGIFVCVKTTVASLLIFFYHLIIFRGLSKTQINVS